MVLLCCTVWPLPHLRMESRALKNQSSLTVGCSLLLFSNHLYYCSRLLIAALTFPWKLPRAAQLDKLVPFLTNKKNHWHFGSAKLINCISQEPCFYWRGILSTWLQVGEDKDPYRSQLASVINGETVCGTPRITLIRFRKLQQLNHLVQRDCGKKKTHIKSRDRNACLMCSIAVTTFKTLSSHFLSFRVTLEKLIIIRSCIRQRFPTGTPVVV